MDFGWVSSQLVIGVLVVILVVGGVAFFAVAAPRRAEPTGEAGVTARDTRAHEQGQDAEDAGVAGETGSAGPGGAGSGGPGGAANASAFETEPCWRSVIRGGQAPADAAAAVAVGGAAPSDFPPTSAVEDAAAPG